MNNLIELKSWITNVDLTKLVMRRWDKRRIENLNRYNLALAGVTSQSEVVYVDFVTKKVLERKVA